LRKDFLRFCNARSRLRFVKTCARALAEITFERTDMLLQTVFCAPQFFAATSSPRGPAPKLRCPSRDHQTRFNFPRRIFLLSRSGCLLHVHPADYSVFSRNLSATNNGVFGEAGLDFQQPLAHLCLSSPGYPSWPDRDCDLLCIGAPWLAGSSLSPCHRFVLSFLLLCRFLGALCVSALIVSLSSAFQL